MQQKRAPAEFESRDASGMAAAHAGPARPDSAVTHTRQRCYGIQVLVAGRRKNWRDGMSVQLRRAGFNATAVDCATDALTVLVLGLPVDVLVTDTDLMGDLRCSRLVREARALRPNLGVVFTSALDDDLAEHVPDALIVPTGPPDAYTAAVREAVAAGI